MNFYLIETIQSSEPSSRLKNNKNTFSLEEPRIAPVIANPAIVHTFMTSTKNNQSCNIWIKISINTISENK